MGSWLEADMDEMIKIAASGFAEYVTGNPKTRDKKLPPFKFKNKGEGAGRSGYYAPAVRAIRRYHLADRDVAALNSARQELLAMLPQAKDRLAVAKIRRNVGALDAYQRLYGERRFKILPNRRISHLQGLVTITAQPDLWVREDKTEVLIKIGIAKKKITETEMLLYLIRKAAIRKGYRVRARNVVYLDVRDGKRAGMRGSHQPVQSYFCVRRHAHCAGLAQHCGEESGTPVAQCCRTPSSPGIRAQRPKERK
jgi:hypothetical protein